MTTRRSLLLVAVIGLALGAGWMLGVWSAGRQDAQPPPAASGNDVLWASNAEVRQWARDARLEITGWKWVEQLDQEIAVFDTVFWEPKDTTSLRARLARPSEVQGKAVLEIGTGSGLLALCCLNAGAKRVVATDVNASALCNTFYNASNLGFVDRLDLRRVPLDDPGAFSVIGDAEKFDYILSNPPWEDDVPEAIDDYAYYDPGFYLLESLLAGLRDHLEPGGRALLAYGATEAIKTIIRLAPQYSLEVRVLDNRDLDTLPEVFLPGMLLEVTPAQASPAGEGALQ
jgi:methylase of polypeptide subunit release factors